MFKYLRENAKLFYWVIAATFIGGFVLMNQGGGGCQGPSDNRFEQGVIGVVNGTKISGDLYDRYFSQQISQYQSRGYEMNENMRANAGEMAWSQCVTNVIRDQAIQEYDIEVSDAEIVAVFKNNPPAYILEQFKNAEDQVDMNRYHAALQDPTADWRGAELNVRYNLEVVKLQEIITQDVAIGDAEVREEFLRQTGKAQAEFMGVLFSDLPNDYTPTDDEVLSWFNSHLDDYQTGAKAQCQVVKYDKGASEADNEEVRTEMLEIKQEILSGETSFEKAAQLYSSDESNKESGGDLGIFDRKQMVAPFTEVAFNTPVGEISDPVLTQFGYHLIEVLEQIMDEESGEVAKVKARHILMKVTPSRETLNLIRESATDFSNRVDSSTFVSTANAEAQDILQLLPGSDGTNSNGVVIKEGQDIPSLPQSVDGSLWATKAAPGEISRLFENSESIYIILVETVTPAGDSELADVRSQVALAVRKEHNKNLALEQLNPAVGEVKMGKTMAEVASAAGLTYAVTDTFTVNANVDKVGYGTDFNKLAIEGTVGTIISDIATLRGVYALIPLYVGEFDAEDYASRRDGIMGSLLDRKGTEVVNTWFEERMDLAEIKDFRHALQSRR